MEKKTTAIEPEVVLAIGMCLLSEHNPAAGPFGAIGYREIVENGELAPLGLYEEDTGNE